MGHDGDPIEEAWSDRPCDEKWRGKGKVDMIDVWINHAGRETREKMLFGERKAEGKDGDSDRGMRHLQLASQRLKERQSAVLRPTRH